MTVLANAQRENDFETTTKRLMKWANRVSSVGYNRFCPGEAWAPSINFYEDAGQYWIVVDLAGVCGNTIDIRVDEKGMMILSGSRAMPQVPAKAGTMRLLLMEIDHGAFCRELSLPDDAQLDAIEASYRTGFLWVRVPKKKKGRQ